MIAIIDYGVGNLFSLLSSFNFVGEQCIVTGDKEVIGSASHIVLPGVGAYGDSMQKLHRIGLISCLKQQAQSGKPFLGICLGMQLLFCEGEEYGTHQGLGLIGGSVVAIQPELSAGGYNLKVPHMGWNALIIKQKNSPLLVNSKEGDSVYFVHSYYAAQCSNAVAATAEYGISIPAIVQKGNIYGCQFHPEKSGEAGLAILKAFAKLNALQN